MNYLEKTKTIDSLSKLTVIKKNYKILVNIINAN